MFDTLPGECASVLGECVVKDWAKAATNCFALFLRQKKIGYFVSFMPSFTACDHYLKVSEVVFICRAKSEPIVFNL